ncbi:phosphatidic acid phosphatase [Caminicella sporogenes]|nr:phosphatidic acid phosphatase [Caminicella sporogenes]
MLEKIKNNNHFLILSYYIIIFFLYKYTEQITRPEYIMHSKIDDYIPFVKEMVVPYLFWYVYITIPLVYFGFNSKKDFYKLSIFMFAGMTICFMIYLIFPNGQDLRPVIVSNDVFSRVIKNIYLLDTPTNSAPSMHVVDSIAVHISIINCEKLKTKKWITVTSFIIMVAIIASTVMIKQHSILDVMYGIGLSLILYLCIYKVNLLQYFKIKKLVSQNQDY